MAKKRIFLKFKDYLKETDIQTCDLCGKPFVDCTCTADNHQNVRFKQYEPMPGTTGPIKNHIVKTKKEENE